MELPKEVLRLFPPDVSDRLRQETARHDETYEELRCRVGQPYTLLSEAGERTLEGARARASDIDYALERASDYSVHACAQELEAGFLHTAGGCRVGLCGAVTEGGMRGVSSISIRIPHEIRGCAAPLLPRLLTGGFQSTLLVSPPGAGKTTLLRDLIRALSEAGYRVSVADERGELAAVHRRAPQYDLGPRTDVMTGGKKSDACMMLVRAMNPQVLAFDEITAPSDVAAVKAASGCGVALLASAHAASARALRSRALYRAMLAEGVFRQAIEIGVRDGARVYKVVEL